MIPVAPEVRIARHAPPDWLCPRCGKAFFGGVQAPTCQRCLIVLGERITAQPTGLIGETILVRTTRSAQQHRAQAGMATKAAGAKTPVAFEHQIPAPLTRSRRTDGRGGDPLAQAAQAPEPTGADQIGRGGVLPPSRLGRRHRPTAGKPHIGRIGGRR